jgi:hypothetical protein
MLRLTTQEEAMKLPDPSNSEPEKSKPGERLRAILSAPADEGSAPAGRSPARGRARPSRRAKRPTLNLSLPALPLQVDRRTLPQAYWTFASSLSLLINAVLLAALLLMARELSTLKQVVGEGLLGGLHSNFVKMDQAHIRADIPVAADVPVDFLLPLSATTEVVLTSDTQISGARVTILAGSLQLVNASATILLPAGARLPIALDMTVPVRTTIPIHMAVPVNIPVYATELHEPLVGLQEVVRPLYCLFRPDAVSLGVPLCR